VNVVAERECNPHTVPAIVGRERELRDFDAVLEDVERGCCRVIGLVGEPGIGKTRLLSEVVARAQARAHHVLCGRATELERDLPFGLLADALDDELVARAAGEVGSVSELDRAQLAAVMPAVGPPAGGSAMEEAYEAPRLARAIRGLLEALVCGRRLTLVLDDVQWADGPSRNVLALLLNRPPRAGLLIAFAARSLSDPVLAAAVATASRSGVGAVRELGPLSSEAAEGLLPRMSAAGRARLYAESGGNPFYLQSLARHPTAVLTGRAEGGGRTVPQPVLAALVAEAAALPPDGRLLLTAAAVVGDPFDLDLAARAADLGDAATMAALDAMLAAQLVRVTEHSRRFRFRHPLVRRAVYESAPAGLRLTAHARAAEALALAGAAPASRAHHVERAAREGDLDAVEVLAAAAADACLHAPDSAAFWYAGALRVLPAAPEHDSRRTALMRGRVRALKAAERIREARDALQELIDRPAGDTPAPTWITAELAHLETWLGRPEEARRRILNARAALSDPTSHDSIALTLELALERNSCGDHAESRSLAAAAMTAADCIGDALLASEAAALAALGHNIALRGLDPQALAEADRWLEEAQARIGTLPDDRLIERPTALLWLVLAQLYTGRHGAAHASAERGLAVARRSGQRFLVAPMLCFRGEAAEELGHLDDAHDAADEALDGALLAGHLHATYWGSMLVARVALARGHHDEALAAAERAVAVTEAVPPSAAGLVLAAVRLAAGDPSGALEALARFDGVDPRLSPRDRLRALEITVRASLALGRHAEAQAWARRAREEAGGRCQGAFAATIARIEAIALMARGDFEPAAESALVGASAAEEVAAPIEAARCRLLGGEALAAAGDGVAGRAHLHQAALELDRLGAVAYRDEALRVLRRLGERPRPVSVASATTPRGRRLATLTPRERQVANLAADGQTNRQIASRLHLSHKTVEKHVSAALAKLGITSRAALARLVERDGVLFLGAWPGLTQVVATLVAA
jgi:DNA-binding CsgD family transcriptional regulator/tetratricopeptide (TPR) repeat protein